MRHGAALSALGIVVLLMTSVDLADLVAARLCPEAPPQSIVVLPFADLSDDQKQQNLADGIVQDLTTDLSRAGQITVIARSTAAAYGHKSPDTRTIGRELGVRYVLEGSVEGSRRSGSRCRATKRRQDGRKFVGRSFRRWRRQPPRLPGRNHRTHRGRTWSGDGDGGCACVVDHPGLLDFLLRGRALMMQTATETRVAAIAEFEEGASA